MKGCLSFLLRKEIELGKAGFFDLERQDLEPGAVDEDGGGGLTAVAYTFPAETVAQGAGEGTLFRHIILHARQ